MIIDIIVKFGNAWKNEEAELIESFARLRL